MQSENTLSFTVHTQTSISHRRWTKKLESKRAANGNQMFYSIWIYTITMYIYGAIEIESHSVCVRVCVCFYLFCSYYLVFFLFSNFFLFTHTRIRCSFSHILLQKRSLRTAEFIIFGWAFFSDKIHIWLGWSDDKPFSLALSLFGSSLCFSLKVLYTPIIASMYIWWMREVSTCRSEYVLENSLRIRICERIDIACGAFVCVVCLWVFAFLCLFNEEYLAATYQYKNIHRFFSFYFAQVGKDKCTVTVCFFFVQPLFHPKKTRTHSFPFATPKIYYFEWDENRV